MKQDHDEAVFKLQKQLFRQELSSFGGLHNTTFLLRFLFLVMNVFSLFIWSALDLSALMGLSPLLWEHCRTMEHSLVIFGLLFGGINTIPQWPVVPVFVWFSVRNLLSDGCRSIFRPILKFLIHMPTRQRNRQTTI